MTPHEDLLRALLNHKIPVALELDEHGKFCYRVSGFYKSDSVLLHPYPEDFRFLFRAIDRYGKKTDIASQSDLVELNYAWLTKREGFEPDSRWLPLLLEAGLLQKQVNYTPVTRRPVC